jgi:hypothetical protein
MNSTARDGISISGTIKINTYRAGMVQAAAPYLKLISHLKERLASGGPRASSELWIRRYIGSVEAIKRLHFIKTAVVCPNLVMDSPNYGIDLVIQRLVGVNTYSLNILYGEIGTGATAPTLADTALTTPTNRASVGFQQNYGSTDAIFQFFFSDSQLANQTYSEFGTFVDGNTTIGSGQLFNHSLLSPTYQKVSGQDTTVEVDFAIANS